MIKPLLATAVLAISTSANAVTYEYGSLLSGSYAPAESFASLTVNNSGNVYDVTFNVFDLNAIFTQGAFIGAVAVSNVPGNDFVPAINISGDAPVAISPGVGPTPIYEMRFDFTDPQSRLTADESVSFTTTLANTVNRISPTSLFMFKGSLMCKAEARGMSPRPCRNPKPTRCCLRGWV